MPAIAQTKADREWRAQMDYEDLVRAEEIKGDKKRMEAALEYGKKKAEEVMEANAGLKVALKG